MNDPHVPEIRQKSRLDRKAYALIDELHKECMRHDGVMLKLELDYKLKDAEISDTEPDGPDLNEFLCFLGSRLIGYAGICSFGGPGSPLEITGMVHPSFRRQGVFSALHARVMAECRRRKAGKILLLCASQSLAGAGFLKKIQAEYLFSEYEMQLDDSPEVSEKRVAGFTLRKATNSDSAEVTRQNRIYFDARYELDPGESKESLILPEEEEKHGMTIYLAELDGVILGKVHLQLVSGVGGIYGLGVLPEFRGRGFGRTVLLQAIRKLKDAHAADILLQVEAGNARALRLYRSCGFKETSVMDYYEMKKLKR